MPEPIPKPITYKSEHYKAWIREQPCCFQYPDGTRCGAIPCDPHHVRRAEFHAGIGKKPHDTVCIPLCREHHDPISEQHIPVFLEIIRHLTRYIEHIGGLQ